MSLYKYKKAENLTLLLMPLCKRWNLFFTRYLTIDVDTMHDSFAKTTKLLLI